MKETVIRETDSETATQTTNVEQNEHGRNVAQRIIWYIAGIIIALLLIRFIFALLGANQGNPFASFIYGVTAPLVAPFSGLFSFDGVKYGVSSVELFTLVAAFIYGLIALAISKLFDLNRR